MARMRKTPLECDFNEEALVDREEEKAREGMVKRWGGAGLWGVSEEEGGSRKNEVPCKRSRMAQNQ